MDDAALIGMQWRTAGERHREIAAEIARETRRCDAGAVGRALPQPQPLGAWRSPPSGRAYPPMTRMAKIALAQQAGQPAPTTSALKQALDEFHTSHTAMPGHGAAQDPRTMAEKLGETFNRELLLKKKEREVRDKDRLLELQQSEINMLNRRLASAVALPPPAPCLPAAASQLDYTPVFPLTQTRSQVAQPTRSQALVQSMAPAATPPRGGYAAPAAASPAAAVGTSSAELQHSFLLSVKDSLETDSEQDELRLLDALREGKPRRRRRRKHSGPSSQTPHGFDDEQLLVAALRMELRRAAHDPSQSWDGVLDLVDCVPGDGDAEDDFAGPPYSSRHPKKHTSKKKR